MCHGGAPPLGRRAKLEAISHFDEYSFGGQKTDWGEPLVSDFTNTEQRSSERAHKQMRMAIYEIRLTIPRRDDVRRVKGSQTESRPAYFSPAKNNQSATN